MERRQKLLDLLKNERKFDYGTQDMSEESLPKKVLIKNFDDLERERRKLHEELKLTEKDVAKSTVDQLAEGYQKLYEKTEDGFQIDTSQFFAVTDDNMRIDCGIIVYRHSMFAYFPEKEFDWVKFRTNLMNEYDLNQKQYLDKIRDEAASLESALTKNDLISTTNRDNVPTHEMTDEKGESIQYCGASKNWRLVDPTVKDHHSLHY